MIVWRKGHYKKSIICIFLAVCLVLQFSNVMSMAIDTISDNEFEVSIQSNSPDVILSGITIDVYAAHIAFF